MAELFDYALHQQTFINLPPERVFEVIGKTGGWDPFFTTGFEIEPKAGGNIFFRWKDWGPSFYTIEVPGKVIEYNPPHTLIFEWGSSMKSVVEFHLSEKFGGTLVHVKESGYPDTPDGIKNLLECACGWGEAVTLMKFYLEHGVVYTPPKK